jgi:hypothetical protein
MFSWQGLFQRGCHAINLIEHMIKIPQIFVGALAWALIFLAIAFLFNSIFYFISMPSLPQGSNLGTEVTSTREERASDFRFGGFLCRHFLGAVSGIVVDV